MKKLSLLFITVTIALVSHAYTWNPVGPDSANISKICFGVGLPYWVLCSDDGMYLYNYSTQECDFYTYGLPVVGATWLSFDKMLVAMGDGSWSDGIWTFDFNTQQFEVIEWNANPNFLLFDDFNHTWWAGFQFYGMMKSIDGLNWEHVDYFDSKSPFCMDFYGDHLVVSEVSNIHNIHISDDGGLTWQETEGAPMITDLDFDGWGNLLGIFPDYSNSSGLWSSNDFGQNWETLFWMDNMSTVGFDAAGEIFVGWEEDFGIARYDPEAPAPGLSYLNEGLPGLNINKIQINPTMSAMAIFASTDSGACFSYDHMVGVEEPILETGIQIKLYPNPANDVLFIQSERALGRVSLYKLNGELLFNQMTLKKEHRIDVSGFRSGVYFVEINSDSRKIVKKLLIR